MTEPTGEYPPEMDLNEFRKIGLIQEINRRFLHPMGLALSVIVEEDGEVSGFGPVYDYRDDPEGLIFEEIDPDKTENVAIMFEEKREVRKKTFGFHIQPYM